MKERAWRCCPGHPKTFRNARDCAPAGGTVRKTALTRKEVLESREGKFETGDSSFGRGRNVTRANLSSECHSANVNPLEKEAMFSYQTQTTGGMRKDGEHIRYGRRRITTTSCSAETAAPDVGSSYGSMR